MARLFIAVDSPPEVKRALEELIGRLRETRAEVRWEHASKLHLTVKFLGETPEALVPGIDSALGGIAAQVSPLAVRYRAVGGFPGAKRPRVIWVGMEDQTGELIRLQRLLEDSMERLGVEREEREFHPHVTLGRVKGEKNLHVLRGMLESVTFERGPVQIRELLLVKSDLQPSGSVYTILKTYPFVGNSHT
jgi:2'-5' RNA ligase